MPSLNSIYRFLRQHELHTKAHRQQLHQPLDGATKCFEAPFVNDLMITDFSPRPLSPPSGQCQSHPDLPLCCRALTR